MKGSALPEYREAASDAADVIGKRERNFGGAPIVPRATALDISRRLIIDEYLTDQRRQFFVQLIVVSIENLDRSIVQKEPVNFVSGTVEIS